MQLIIYTTEGCHLCELAVQLLINVAPRLSIEIEVELVDIAFDDHLITLFGEKIPVFEYQQQQICWPFDEQAIVDLLKIPAV